MVNINYQTLNTMNTTILRIVRALLSCAVIPALTLCQSRKYRKSMQAA